MRSPVSWPSARSIPENAPFTMSKSGKCGKDDVMYDLRFVIYDFGLRLFEQE